MINEERLHRARLAIEGLAVGDAYGNHHGNNPRKHGAPVWGFSDDTLMALSIVENLRKHGEIDQDALAQSFASRWDGKRGYGRGVTRLLKRIQEGADWHEASSGMFDGQGSYGNGAAMRVAPIGGYFADDLDVVVEQAARSATVTHMHPEGIAGAVAVAVAAALAFRYRNLDGSPSWQEWLEEIVRYIPEGGVHDKMINALDLDVSTGEAAKTLGNGRPAIAQMTVPFALWCASHFLDNFEAAILQAASVMGDVDTNCAIVGGIVVLYSGLEGIPAAWIERREGLPKWAFEDK